MIKNVANSKELALEIAQKKFIGSSNEPKLEITSVSCGCGETKAISLYNGKQKVVVGFCPNCGSAWENEIDVDIIRYF